jgi:hypothetical protein
MIPPTTLKLIFLTQEIFAPSSGFPKSQEYCRTPDRGVRGHWLAESQQSSKGGEF